MSTNHVVVQDNSLWCRACGCREPLLLPLSAKDFSHFCQTWAQAHKDCVHEHFMRAEDRINRLREVIAAWPEATHNSGCAPMQDGGPCYCGTAALNARRKEARRVAGLSKGVEP